MYPLLRLHVPQIGFVLGLILMIVMLYLITNHWPYGKMIKGLVVGLIIAIFFILLFYLIFQIVNP